MKIKHIKIKGLFDENFDVYLKAGDLSSGCDEVFCSAADLKAVVALLFEGKTAGFRCDGSAECAFCHNGKDYLVSRTKSFDNLASMLREKSGQTTKRYTQADKKLDEILGEEKQAILNGMVISADDFASFCLDPSVDRCKSIAALTAVATRSRAAGEQAQDAEAQLKLKIKATAAKPMSIGKAQMTALKEEEKRLKAQYEQKVEEAENIRSQMRTLITRDALERDLATNQEHIDRLAQNAPFMDKKRKQLEDHRKIQTFLPRLKEILSFKKQLAEAKEKAEADKEELDWLKSERDSIVRRLEEINTELNRTVEQNARLALMRSDSESLDGLTRRNEELADRITDLQVDKEKLEQVRDEHKQAIANADRSIAETENRLQNIDVPVRSINELVENVRVNARIKEVEDGISRTDGEIALVSAQIGDREAEIKKLQETMTTLLKADNAVTPLKSKDTILQMLQARISKNEVIMQSLNDKQNNLREEMQNLHYKEIEIDQSCDCLQTILAQRQFDRDRLLKKQALSEQDALPVPTAQGMAAIAPTATYAYVDEHIESLRSDIVKRNNRKLELVARQSTLKGVMNEVERQKQITLGEITACRNERDAILGRFREMTRPGSDPVLNDYYRALEAGRSTGFVLDAQRALVQKQTEVALFKEKYQSLTKDKQDLTARLTSLSEAQAALDVKQMTVEMMVESNDKVKSALAEVTERLAMLYTQRRLEEEAVAAAETRIFNLATNLADAMNEKKANEKEILKINRKIAAFTQSETEEDRAAAQEKTNELLSEKKMFEDSREEADDKVLAKSVEIEKDAVVLANVMTQYQTTRDDARDMMQALGDDDVEKLKLKNLSAEAYAAIRDTVDRYDATMEMLLSRRKQMQQLFDENADGEAQARLQQQLTEKLAQCDEAKNKLEQCRALRERAAEAFMTSNNTKAELKTLLAQYENGKALRPVIDQSKLVEQIYLQEAEKLLARANEVFAKTSDGQIVIRNGKFAVKRGDAVTFDSLSLVDKLCVFLSLAVMQQSVDCPSLETVILCGRSDVDAKQAAKRLAGINGKNFIAEAMSVEV